MTDKKQQSRIIVSHRFLDEAGDATFYGKGKSNIIGTEGVSLTFNVQDHYTEPLLNIADYLSWSVQRVFERGEMRYYNFIRDKISLVVDLYEAGRFKGNENHYSEGHYLTAINKISPPSP